MEKTAGKGHFSALIEANLEELIQMRIQVLYGDPVLQIYLEVLIAYLQHDIPKLEGLVRSIRNMDPALPGAYFLALASVLRLEIRTFKVREETLKHAFNLAQEDHARAGELYFLAGLAYESMGDHSGMARAFKMSVLFLEVIGAKKKAVKAMLNFIAAESRVDPTRKLIADYYTLYKRAKKVKAYGVAGIALKNISREYQLVGAHLAALKCINRAIVLLEHEFNTKPYYLALVHRCHVYLDLGRNLEAEMDYQTAKTTTFPEVLGALEVIDMIRGQNKSKPSAVDHLTPTWRERMLALQAIPEKQRLGTMEDRLVHLLGQGACTKHEIIETLYGERISFEALEKRFHNLLIRVRKKYPGLVIFTSGRYCLADESLVDQLDRKVG